MNRPIGDRGGRSALCGCPLFAVLEASRWLGWLDYNASIINIVGFNSQGEHQQCAHWILKQYMCCVYDHAIPLKQLVGLLAERVQNALEISLAFRTLVAPFTTRHQGEWWDWKNSDNTHKNPWVYKQAQRHTAHGVRRWMMQYGPGLFFFNLWSQVQFQGFDLWNNGGRLKHCHFPQDQVKELRETG